MESEWYLQRNEIIINEIQDAVDNGLIFQRSNIKRVKGGSVTSTIGVYPSTLYEEDVFIGLQEFTSSSANLKTRYHLGFAKWYAYNFPKDRSKLSLFYGLLKNNQGDDIGMIFEDITKGGEIPVTENSQQDLIFERGTSSREVIMKQIIDLEVNIGEDRRIIDATKFLPIVALNELTDFFYLRFQKDEQPLPAVVFPREIP